MPTVLKLAHGETRPSRVNYSEPALPLPASDEPPADLTGEGLDEWRRLIGPLTTAGVLRDADLGSFTDYCFALSDLRRYETEARRLGLKEAIAQGIQNQTVKLRAQVSTLRSHLGLTPSSRAGVHAVKVKRPVDERQLRFFGSMFGPRE